LMSARTIPFICIAYTFNDSVPIRCSAPVPCPEGVHSLQGKHLREETEDYRDVHKLLKYSIDIYVFYIFMDILLLVLTAAELCGVPVFLDLIQ
jgi:hypothetical protein